MLLNYYRSYYADNKFKGQIIITCYTKQKLTEAYHELYSTIKKYKIDDILTLKKFASTYDSQLKELFEKLENKNIRYSTILNKIKTEYKPSKSIYKECSFAREAIENNLPKGYNIIFITTSDLKRVNNKAAVREIFVPELVTLNKDDDNSYSLCEAICSYADVITNIRKILKDNNAKESEFLILNVFINSSDGLALEDEVIDRIKGR